MRAQRGIVSFGTAAFVIIAAAACDHLLPSKPAEVSNDGVVTFGLRDPVGDAQVSFVDLTKVTVDVHELTVGVRIKVRNLPEELLYNRRGLPVGHIEYMWHVFFDLNGKDSFEGDVILTLANVIEQWAETDRAPLVDFALPEMWICDSTGTDLTFCCNPAASTKGSSIFLDVNKSCYPMLDEIHPEVAIQVLAYHNDGSSECSDWMPDVVGSPPAAGRVPTGPSRRHQ